MTKDVAIIFYMNGHIKNYLAFCERTAISEKLLQPHFTQDVRLAMRFDDQPAAADQIRLIYQRPGSCVQYRIEWISIPADVIDHIKVIARAANKLTLTIPLFYHTSFN